MDALNKNFPVGQPDANGNYEWMQVRAGEGISTTGNIDMYDGDLDMNGGIINNWNDFIPPPPGAGVIVPYWKETRPINATSSTTQFFGAATAATPLTLDNVIIPVNPGPPIGAPPWGQYIDFAQQFIISDPGTYLFRVSLKAISNTAGTGNRVDYRITAGTPIVLGITITGTNNFEQDQTATDFNLAPQRQTEYIFIVTQALLDSQPTPFITGQVTIRTGSGPWETADKNACGFTISKLSDTVQATSPIPPA